MIGHLSGTLLETTTTHPFGWLVGVGSESTGIVGYQVLVPASPEYAMEPVGARVKLWVHTHVREDAFDLFGFRTSEEKELFESLIHVAGIGPKSALGIMAAAPAEKLIHAILDEDKSYLVGLPGIGKKTAERVILESKDLIRKKLEGGRLASLSKASPAKNFPAPSYKSTLRDEACLALVGLGYKEAEAFERVERVLSRPERPARVEDLIKSALQN